MHDIKAIRDNPQAFDAGLKRRGLSPLSPSLLAIDEKRRAAILASEQAQARRNAASKEIGDAKKTKDEARANRLMAEVAELKTKMPELEAAAKTANEELARELSAIPNLPLDEVPDGTGTCTAAGLALTCRLGDVTVTGKVRVIVPVRWTIYPGAGAQINTASITTEQVDPNPGNNTATEDILVTRSSLEGLVFEDRDRAAGNGGTQQTVTGEPGIAGVTVVLTGTDLYGNAVNLTLPTAADGAYRFENLSPSDASGYTITQTQPAGYVNGPIDPPAAGGSAPSLGGTYVAGSPNSVISAIPVGANQAGVRYNFPEVRQPSLSGFVYVDANSCRDRCTSV